MVDPMVSFEGYKFSNGERVLYDKVFDAVQTDGMAGGDDVAELLRKSNIPDAVLGRIWDICDRSLKGYLTKVEMYVALRGVALVQRGESVTVEALSGVDGLDLNQLPRLGPDFPLPSVQELGNSGSEPAAPFMSRGVLARKSINPQFYVAVSPPVKHEGTITEHMVYAIEVHCTIGVLANQSTVVNRRYSDFEWLRNRLLEDSLGHVVPTLPQKKYFGRFERQFLEVRRRGLEDFLNTLTADPHYMNAKPLVTFLQSDDEAFAKARAQGPSLIEQVLQTLRETLLSMANRGGEGVLSGPSEGHLAQLVKQLDVTATRLMECKRLHEAVSDRAQKRVATLSDFVLNVLPSVTPLSMQEINQLNATLHDDFEQHRREQKEGFDEVLQTLVSQVKSLQEVVRQQDSARRKVDSVHRKLESKQSKQANLKDDKDAGSIEKDIASLSKEGDAAQHKLDTISRALEQEIVEYEAQRKKQLGLALGTLTRLEAQTARTQREWWKRILQRTLQANSSPLAARIDVPRSVVNEVDMMWCSSKEAKSFVKKKTIPLFQPGAAAEQTIPMEGEGSARPSDAHEPMVHSSFGVHDANSGQYEEDDDLPAYARATPSAAQFHQTGGRYSDVNEDDMDGLIFARPEAQQAAGAVPSHWDS